MAAWVANLTLASAVLLVGISLLLTVVATFSYLRLRSRRLLWVAVAFGIAVLQGIIMVVVTFQQRGDIEAGGTGLPLLAAVNVALVLALYLSLLQR